MDKLWAPWRSQYIGLKKIKGRCIFCEKYRDSPKNYMIKKTRFSFVMLNIFPYNNGHLMVAPYRHIKNLEDLKEKEMVDLFKTTCQMVKALKKTMHPKGFNIGLNIGGIAGAGYEGHLHVHIVPRWPRDTNFMPVIADTKVIPQSLKELYKNLKDYVNSRRD